MSCANCPPPATKEATNSAPNEKSLSTRALQVCSIALPESFALLSCSCCWLPTILDLVFAGSVTAASLQNLRYVFLAISILSLAWGLRREGLSRSMICRIVISGGMLAWAQYKERTEETREAITEHRMSGRAILSPVKHSTFVSIRKFNPALDL
ncbi:hypothetical protein P170DRAFT_460775 [Aspergillus steynii IBT 23096]|uniref:Uncharacterized protein n=1 Tax=Aspergillus steynii IBT 23096 TaxID=1392250 RepID=A0A2I2GPA3_9EURO|nr:uncharacterized protein P170DRAFT_460775 [Aspergillus steynii IBT 23096]PLB54706.1 hypothetical protein P170DRAFT_460775 [Aspergillus steynii IBT 23096]